MSRRAKCSATGEFVNISAVFNALTSVWTMDCTRCLAATYVLDVLELSMLRLEWHRRAGLAALLAHNRYGWHALAVLPQLSG